jgi:hypothetical protein
MRQIEIDKSSEDMLVAFGLTMIGQTGAALVRNVPGIVPHMGPVIQQVRAYYECLWQIDLLRRCQTTRQALGNSGTYSEQ